MSEPSPPAPDIDAIEHVWARTACRISVVAAGAAMAGLCTGGASFLVALPLGLLALWLGYRALLEALPNSATRAYAKMAIAVAGVTVGFGAAWAIVIGAYTAMFVALIFLANA